MIVVKIIRLQRIDVWLEVFSSIKSLEWNLKF